MTLADWSTAPEWAQWYAVDKSKLAFWYDKKPEAGEREWNSQERLAVDCAGYVPLSCDWRDTLEQRPQVPA